MDSPATDHQGPILAESHGKQVIDCVTCGFKHVAPLPGESELRRFYAEEFYGGFHEEYIEGQKRDLEWWKLEFEAKYRLFEAELPADARRLLDVGSGAGWFLQFGADRGWTATGIEPSRTACKYARTEMQLEVIEGFFEPMALVGQKPFDVVHLNNVLEHVVDPAALVQTAGSIQQPGGLIAVTVPNDFSPLQEALVELRGHEPWWVDPREHLNYFDRASLEKLLTAHGYAPRRSLGSFPLEFFALMGEDYLADPGLGPDIHRKRMAFEHALHETGRAELQADLYEKLAEMGLGRLVTVIAAKL